MAEIFNLKRELKEESVTPEKTTFFDNSLNLYDKTNVGTGFFSYDNGAYAGDSDYRFYQIKVAEGEKYYINKLAHIVYTSNIDYATYGTGFISGDVNTSNQIKRLTIPTGATYVIISILATELDTMTLSIAPLFEYIPNCKNILNASEIDLLNKWKGKKIAFLGDSITAGYIDGTNWCSYAETIQMYLGLNSIQNLAISGAHISSAYTYSGSGGNPSDALTYQQANIEIDVDAIIIAGGTNDYGDTANTAPFGNITDDNGDTNFCSGVRALLSAIQQTHPTTPVFICTPLHRNYSGDTLGEAANSLGKTLLDYVNTIKTIAQDYGLPIIDLYSIAGLNHKKSINTYYQDGLHLNYRGAEKVGKIISKYLIDYTF